MHFLMPEKCEPNCVFFLRVFQVALTNEFDLMDVDHEVEIKQLHTQLESLILR